MLIFIDEAGRFTPGDGISLICALAMPHKSAGPCRRELLRVSKSWPHRNGELKSGELETTHLCSLIDVLFRNDALLHVVATDPSNELPSEVAEHQTRQAIKITKHLNSDHSRSLIDEVWALRHALESMPAQLYVQCVAMHQLVWHVAEDSAIYFSQRRPKELGKFEWIIDAKDPVRITSQEQWWRDVIGPLGESRSRRKPFVTVHDTGFDYTHFDRAFSMEKEMWYPDMPTKLVNGVNIKKLISDNVAFVDSKSELLVQATDVVAGFVRRAVRARKTDPLVLQAVGRLMIRAESQQTVRLITLGAHQEEVESQLAERIDLIARSARAMLKPERSARP
jgi:hypothetical protein